MKAVRGPRSVTLKRQQQLEALIQEQANAIGAQADAVATGRLIGPRHLAAVRILDNAKTLLAWIDQADGPPT